MIKEEIVIVDMDDWMAIYVDGVLKEETDRYMIDKFDAGFKYAKKYPNYSFAKYELSLDCIFNNNLPLDLKDIEEFLK